MQVSDKLIRPLTEAKYLNADNVSRYRCIMRIFFEHYEKLKYWLYQEEVYEEMIQDPFFADYRMEQCQQDLMMLTEWKNLNTIQDTKKVASIEEFKNKKYRYQMTEYSVEIERLVIRLENLFIEGASLEPTLLERIRRSVERFPEMGERDKSEVYTWWTDLNNDFVRLNQNYQDYILQVQPPAKPQEHACGSLLSGGSPHAVQMPHSHRHPGPSEDGNPGIQPPAYGGTWQHGGASFPQASHRLRS